MINRQFARDGEPEEVIQAQENTPTTRKALSKELKIILPSTRKRISSLRESKDDTPTSKADDLGRIIKDFWGQRWRRIESEDDGSIESFLGILLPRARWYPYGGIQVTE